MGSKDFINYKLDFFNEICENTHGRENLCLQCFNNKYRILSL